MPIYAYRCTNCGHAQDVLQRISDPLLTVCPACGQATLQKQVTAAGFQLKGSGWYVTDFRGDSRPGKPGDGDAKPSESESAPAGATSDAPASAASDAPAPAPKSGASDAATPES